MSDIAPSEVSVPRPPTEHRYWVRAQIWSLIEVPLLLLLAYVFAFQTGSSYTYTTPPDQFGGSSTQFGTNPPLYFTAYLWIATVAALAAAGLMLVAFRKQRAARLRLLILANSVAAGVAGVGVLGDLIVRSIWSWTTTDSSSSTFSPSPTGIISMIIAAVAIAVAATMLPAIIGLALRRHGPAPNTI